jgi:hypothetical protein
MGGGTWFCAPSGSMRSARKLCVGGDEIDEDEKKKIND